MGEIRWILYREPCFVEEARSFSRPVATALGPVLGVWSGSLGEGKAGGPFLIFCSSSLEPCSRIQLMLALGIAARVNMAQLSSAVTQGAPHKGKGEWGAGTGSACVGAKEEPSAVPEGASHLGRIRAKELAAD